MTKASLSGVAARTGKGTGKGNSGKSGKKPAGTPVRAGAAGSASFGSGMDDDEDSDDGNEDSSDDDSGDDDSEKSPFKKPDAPDAGMGDDEKDEEIDDDGLPDPGTRMQVKKLIAEFAEMGVRLPDDIKLTGDLDVILAAIQTHKHTKGVSEADKPVTTASAGDAAQQGERQVTPVSMSAMPIDEIAAANPAVAGLLADASNTRKEKTISRIDSLVATGRATIPQAKKLKEMVSGHSFSSIVAGKETPADRELEIRIATLEENPENAFASFSANGTAGNADGEKESGMDSFFTASPDGKQTLSAGETEDAINVVLGIVPKKA